MNGAQFRRDDAPEGLSIDKSIATLKIQLSIHHAGIAQLVERNLAKVEVASSSLVSRSKR